MASPEEPALDELAVASPEEPALDELAIAYPEEPALDELAMASPEEPALDTGSLLPSCCLGCPPYSPIQSSTHGRSLHSRNGAVWKANPAEVSSSPYIIMLQVDSQAVCNFAKLETDSEK
jgi:hypothetical protein